MPIITITSSELNTQSYQFDLSNPLVSIGRSAENDIIIDCNSISGKHAQMERINGGYRLKDLGSTNGIEFGNEKVASLILEPDVKVKIGSYFFEIRVTELENEAFLFEKKHEAKQLIVDHHSIQTTNSSPLAKLALVVSRLLTRPILGKKILESTVSYRPHIHSDNEITVLRLVKYAVLIVLAFGLGLFFRHKKETGKLLHESMFVKQVASKTSVISEENP